MDHSDHGSMDMGDMGDSGGMDMGGGSRQCKISVRFAVQSNQYCY